jgi:hypothetical protein
MSRAAALVRLVGGHHEGVDGSLLSLGARPGRVALVVYGIGVDIWTSSRIERTSAAVGPNAVGIMARSA